MKVSKFIPKKLVKDISPLAQDIAGNKRLQNGSMISAINCRIGNTSSNNRYLCEGVPSNVSLNMPLADGVNRCIKSHFYEKENSIIMFIYNDQGTHSIIEYNSSGDFVELLSGALNFHPDFPISFVDDIDQFLIYADSGRNPIKCLNIERARAGEYVGFTDYSTFDLVKKKCLHRPIISREDNTNIEFNYISGKNYQFAVRYTFLDDMVTAIGPISRVSYADAIPDLTSSIKNQISVYTEVPADLLLNLKAIDFLVREGNIGNFKIFETVLNPVQQNLTVKFVGNESLRTLSDTDQSHPFESLSDDSKFLAIVENRVFADRGSYGFDVDETKFSLSPKVLIEAYNPSAPVPFFPENSVHNVAIKFFDSKGRESLGKAEKTVRFQSFPTSYTDVNNSSSQTINSQTVNLSSEKPKYWASRFIQNLEVNISGTPPQDAAYYQILLSKDSFYTVYSQFLCNVLFYKTEARSDDRLVGNEVQINDKIFQVTADNDCNYLYLQIPNNLPVVVDKDYKVRIFDPNWLGDRIVGIVEIVGNYLVLDVPGVYRPNSPGAQPISSIPQRLFVEILKPKTEKSDIYYSYSKVFKITDNQWESTRIRLEGYTHKHTLNENEDVQRSFVYDSIFDAEEQNQSLAFRSNRARDAAVEINAPTPSFDSTNASTEIVQTENSLILNGNIRDFPNSDLWERRGGYTLNYNLVDGDYGSPTIADQTESKISRGNVLVYSDPYVQNSFINGLNRFVAVNRYPLPSEKSPMTALVRNSDNLLLFQERSVTSLYIGEGFIQDGGNGILAKTQNVIGDDRDMIMSYGTVHPESISQVNGRTFFWDQYKGKWIQASQEGLQSIINDDISQFFLLIKRAIDNYGGRLIVISTYDEENDELLVTMPEVKISGVVVSPAVTLGYNLTDREWKSEYKFIPEFYLSANANLYSFKFGQMYRHNTEPTCNNFYGTQYNRELTYCLNDTVSKHKRLLNISLKMNQLAKSDSDILIEISTPEGQSTYLRKAFFEKNENQWIAEILKDINTDPTLIPEGHLALRSGIDLRSNIFFVKLIDNTGKTNPLEFINLIYKEEEISM